MLILFFRQMKISLQHVKGFKIHRRFKKEKNVFLIVTYPEKKYIFVLYHT